MRKWLRKYWWIVALVGSLMALVVGFLIYIYMLKQKAVSIAKSFNSSSIDQATINLKAFLMMIRSGESNLTDSAYYTVVGGGLVSDLSSHPHKYVASMNSDAFGAYQILGATWDTEVQPNLHLPDCSPDSQDRAAVFLIVYRGAYDDVVAGNFDAAISKCSWEWASLVDSSGKGRYGQSSKSYASFLSVYKQFGGQTA